MKHQFSLCLLTLSLLPVTTHATFLEEEKSVQMAPLKSMNWLVGSWRGTGQPKRGSTRGAWSEKMTCQWEFKAGPSILLKSDGGKEFGQLTISTDSEHNTLRLQQTKGDLKRVYRADIPEEWTGKIQLLSDADSHGVSWRCTIQQLSEIRSTLLFERRSTPTGSFRRVAGIGYTRSGTRLADGGAGKRTCIVTGGLGTIAVKHKGKTYYVCCQGCVQAFNASPDEIIADYLASLKSE